MSPPCERPPYLVRLSLCTCALPTAISASRQLRKGVNRAGVDTSGVAFTHSRAQEAFTTKNTRFCAIRDPPRRHTAAIRLPPQTTVFAQVTFDSTIVGYPALIGLVDFSHVWLLFVFHDNTNATVNGVVEEKTAVPVVAASIGCVEDGNATSKGSIERGEGGAEGESRGETERWGGGAREYQAPKHKLRQTFLTKVW